ncbi:MAG: hypothetical protein KIT09_34960 [Bryobacteraceae bacterium]|nr:hypothetical protein [Bryobacteraceae bacterium]
MRFRLSLLWIFPLLCLSARAQQAPQFNAVMNAASYWLPALPNPGLAQGSMFVAFGTNLGPARLAMADPPLPKSLGDTVVHVSAEGFEEDAYLFYTSATQVAGILPSRTPAGGATLTVTYGGKTSNRIYVWVTARGLGLLTRNQAGFGAATLQNYNSPADQPINSPAAPANPGQAVILWGTGLGAIQGDDGATPPVGNLSDRVEALVGSATVTPFYAGRSSQFPSIDQVNFVVPDGVHGCHVPLAVRVDGILSNYVTMAIAPPGKTCADPSGLGEAETAALMQKGELRVGVINLGRVRGAAGVSDAGSGEFLRRTLAQMHTGAGAVDVYSTLGACYVYTMRAGDRAEWFPFDVMNNTPLDAGQALNLARAGAAKTIALTQKGSFSASLGGEGQTFLEPGEYVVDNGSGGADVGPFRATLAIPAPVEWTNQASFAAGVSRGAELTVEWTGGDPEREFVFIAGASMDGQFGATRGFVCSESAGAHRFQVPRSIVGLLPASRPAPGVDGGPTAFLAVGTQLLPAAGKFTAPGLDAGYFLYASQTALEVTYR